jgi:hypothetical protein
LIDLSQQLRQSAHLFPCLGAGHEPSVLETVDVFSKFSGSLPSIMAAETLTQRLSGNLPKVSKYWLIIFFSLVGIQNLTLGKLSAIFTMSKRCPND